MERSAFLALALSIAIALGGCSEAVTAAKYCVQYPDHCR
jgi:hypothetical protein